MLIIKLKWLRLLLDRNDYVYYWTEMITFIIK